MRIFGGSRGFNTKDIIISAVVVISIFERYILSSAYLESTLNSNHWPSISTVYYCSACSNTSKCDGSLQTPHLLLILVHLQRSIE